MCINPLTGETIFDYVNEDNVWDIEIIGNQIAFTDQMGCVGYIDSSNGQLNSKLHIATELEIVRWDEIMMAQMNMWDLYYDGKDLYATSENGKLYIINGSQYQEVELGTINDELLMARKMYNTEWIDNKSVYSKTGYGDSDFNSHKIIDDYDGYLLISAYMIDPDMKNEYGASDFEPVFAVYNKETKTVETLLSYERFTNKASALIGEYNGEKAIITVGNEDSLTKVRVFDYEGKELYNTTIVGMDCSKGVELTRKDGNYIIEAYHGGCCQLNDKVSEYKYLFDKVSTKLLQLNDDSFVATYNINGEISKIVCNLFDMETVKWEYDLDIKEPNKGIEKTFVDDFNNDGIDDIICVINTFDNKFEQNNGSYIVILSGEDGKALAKTKLLNYKYYDYDKKKYVYDYAVIYDNLTLIKDTNKDGKREIVVDGMVYSTKNYTLLASLNTYIENYSPAVKLGDVNGDGIEDWLFVSEKNASVGQSYYQNEAFNYKLTGKKINIVKDKGAYTYAFGDINNDGVTEIAVYALNAKGFQVYDIYDGKTLDKLFTLCPEGVGDYEIYYVLDYDINGDGYNEIFGYTSTVWCKVLLDGKTGEVLHYFSDSKEDDKFEDIDYWHPEYDVPLSNNLADYGFDYSSPMLVDDVNGDGYRDLAYYKTYWNEDDWSSVNALMIYDSQTFNVIKEISMSVESNSSMQIKRVKNTDRYFALVGYDSFALYDYKENDVVANYKLLASNYTLVDNSTLMVTNNENQVYMLNIDKGFEMVDTPDEVTDNNYVDLKWKNYSEYSTMQIYDNGTLVYTGVEEEYRLNLLDGHHTIIMSCTDAYGKSSKCSFDVTVTDHKNTAYWIVGVAAVSLAAALYINLHRKAYVKSHGKEVL